ncbi:vomeronasal type-2 receptor 116-like [Thomomys bottae]
MFGYFFWKILQKELLKVCRYIYKNYKFVLAVAFAVEEINKNPNLLHNTTLGFDIYDIDYGSRSTLYNPIIWLSRKHKIPNYSCRRESNSIAVLTGISGLASAQIGTLLGVYRFPQLTFGPFDYVLSDKSSFPSLYQMAPKDTSLPAAMVSLMLHFSWTWVGLFILLDENSLWIILQLREEMAKNKVYMEQCVKCPDHLYANMDRNQCLLRAESFLAHGDPLGMALACLALCLSTLTAAILGLFVKYRDTAIVKANNRTLSYILLNSLIFCFLCALLFIGHPYTATCILQQITFGVLFTVAVSTVLAKTVTVVLAFKATSPGRRMRWLLVSGAPNLLIPICTLIQVSLCGLWLGSSPPFVDTDAHSEHGHIIILCNKGSLTAFYCVLGSLGSLALASFTVAFLARNLPDTFSEAKFLTFSMLVFCSVWLTFLPVYHSAKGKVMVAVEVFSILASGAGLLGCIFVPKCSIILLKSDRNSLHHIWHKTYK